MNSSSILNGFSRSWLAQASENLTNAARSLSLAPSDAQAALLVSEISSIGKRALAADLVLTLTEVDAAIQTLDGMKRPVSAYTPHPYVIARAELVNAKRYLEGGI